MAKEKKLKAIRNDFECKAVEKTLPEIYSPTETRNYYYSLRNNSNDSQVLISLTYLYKILQNKYNDLEDLRYKKLLLAILEAANKILNEMFKEADHKGTKLQTWKSFSKIIANDEKLMASFLTRHIRKDTDLLNLYLTIPANKKIKRYLQKNYILKIAMKTKESPLDITKAPEPLQNLMIEESIKQFLEEKPSYSYEAKI